MPDAPRDPNRRLTNAERREEARRKREELQRQLAKKKRSRLVGGIALLLALALLVAVIVLQPFAGPSPQDVLAQASAATRTAGCGEVETIDPYGDVPADDPESQDRLHIGGTPEVPTAPPLSSYPSVPPTSGPHSAVTLPGGVYDTPPAWDQAIHSLEHGAAIVWYDPLATGPELDELKKFYSQKLSSRNVSQDRVIVAPFDYPEQGEAGLLPEGTRMALVSWHRLEECADVSLPAAFDFTSQYAFPTFDERPYLGSSPEGERGGAI